ncbi:SpoIIE family protein phosphatase [Streptomyces sp. NPDC052301]|uniref:SpoIIE family protein phosphatase n=1 Tax=Streptomyces sp. NPDC052301 TaxID=3365687 RepID=UPI0037D4C1FC
MPTDQAPRPQVTLSHRPGDTPVRYADGLIERRGEAIDAGLHRLTDTRGPQARMGPAEPADTLLIRLGVADGGRDDIALVLVRL